MKKIRRRKKIEPVVLVHFFAGWRAFVAKGDNFFWAVDFFTLLLAPSPHASLSRILWLSRNCCAMNCTSRHGNSLREINRFRNKKPTYVVNSLYAWVDVLILNGLRNTKLTVRVISEAVYLSELRQEDCKFWTSAYLRAWVSWQAVKATMEGSLLTDLIALIGTWWGTVTLL